MQLQLSPTHQGKRILIAGCGTLETLIIAEQHPLAQEIVAVDLSSRSLAILKRRLTFARLRNRFRIFSKRKLPPIRLVCADLNEWKDGKFDFIFASNILQHVQDPAALFKRISSWLNPDALLRIVTYPYQSRLFMRLTAQWLKQRGLNANDPRLIQKATNEIKTLPANHFVRSCFESQPETKTRSGLIDAFFHACEKPLPPLEWKITSEDAGLTWICETQHELSHSNLLIELVPETAFLKPWVRLQILDDLLEICSNPTLWFVKRKCDTDSSAQKEWQQIAPHFQTRFSDDIEVRLKQEMSLGLKRAQILLAKAGVTLDQVMEKLKEEIGPRVAEGSNKVLHGLSVTEYEWRGML